MKKSILLFATFIFLGFQVSSEAFAQGSDEKKSPVRFGVKGGLNYSKLFVKGSESSTMLSGFNVGLFAKLPIASIISIQPELYFITKGSEVSYGGLLFGGTAKFNLNYMEFPLLIVANLNKNLNVHIGPYASYLISAKATNTATLPLFDFETNININNYNRVDAGIMAGAGIDVGAVGLGVRYSLGLKKVGKEESFLGTTYSPLDARNGVFYLYASISLN